MPENAVDVTQIVGTVASGEDEELAFANYRDAFNTNAERPGLWNAVKLVEAWNVLAKTMGLDIVELAE